MSNKPFLLALNRIPQVGPRTISKLLEHWPNLEEMFGLSFEKLQREGLSEKLARAISRFDFADLDADWRWQEMKGNHLLSIEDATYPALLKEIYDPPAILYATGDLACFKDQAIAMVGSRNPTATGLETSRAFAYELAKQKLCIVSGLARGIDERAHVGAMEAAGKTIAVMGTGMDYIYPRHHGPLAAEIGQKGLLITEFPLGSPPIAGHFPRRNRIISGLSLVTLVVEAAIRSGSLITARFALEQNRDVLAIPGSIHSPQARGCNYLLQQGAKIAMSVQDVLNELGSNNRQIDEDLSRDLASCDKNLVQFIGFELTAIDTILERSGLGLEQAACELVDLELQGLVKSVPGGYMRCTL